MNKLEILQETLTTIEEYLSQSEGALKVIDGESKFINSVDRMMDLLIKDTSLMIGDHTGMLDWYVWDNECGNKGFEVTVGGEKMPADTAEELMAVIERIGETSS